MSSIKSKTAASVIALFAADSFFLNATAQSADTSAINSSAEDEAADSRVLGTVIVSTARRREEPLQTTPVSVAAFDAAALVERGIVDTLTIAESVPGVHFARSSANPSGIELNIRGLIQGDYLITGDPLVGVYLDDMYIARAHAALTDLLDIEQVEVLRGPQGTLFGRNTSGGAVRLATNKASVSEGFGGYLDGSIGDFDYLKLSGAVNIPIVEDKFAIRVAAQDISRSGYTTTYVVPRLTFVDGVTQPTSVVDTDDHDSTSYRVSATFEPSEDLRFEAQLGGYDYSSNAALVANIPGDLGAYALGAESPVFEQFSSFRQNDFYSAVSDIVPRAAVETQYASIKGEYDINENLSTKLILSYLDGENETVVNAAGIVSAPSIIPAGTAGSPAGAFIDFEPAITTTQEQYTAEWQILGESGPLNWIAGVYYFKEEGTDKSTSTTRIFGGNPAGLEFDASAENESKSVFAHLEYQLTDKLGISGGARYTEDEKSFVGMNTVPAAGGVCVFSDENGAPLIPCAFNQSDTFDYVTYQFGVDYEFTPVVFGYASISNGFRGGGQQLRAIDAVSAEEFDPDEVISYEAGLKATWFDGRLVTNAAVYYSEYEDIQTTQVLVRPLDVLGGSLVTTTAVANFGKAEIQGLEFESILNVTENLSFVAKAGLVDFEYKEAPAGVDTQINTPEEKFALSAVYDQPLSFADLSARLDWNSTSDFFATENSSSFDALIEGRELLDARIGLAWDNGFSVAIWGRNLTEEEYFTNATIASGTSLRGVAGAGVGAPRTVGIDVRKSF